MLEHSTLVEGGITFHYNESENTISYTKPKEQEVVGSFVVKSKITSLREFEEEVSWFLYFNEMEE